MGRSIERVIAVYEAGWSGFWLARWLMRHGVEVHVVQPSSVPVDRRVRRAKSDGIDSELLLRTLLAWLRGEPRVCSVVPVPDEADEDARRCVRERTELISERIGLTNRIGVDIRLRRVPTRCPPSTGRIFVTPFSTVMV
jgi:transposase